MKILITGGTSGIGYHLALNLLKRKHFVILTAEKELELENLQEKIKHKKVSNYICKKLDITNKEDIKEILKLDFDCLVNLAAIGIGGSILDVPISKLKQNFETNFFATFNLIKEFIKRQKENNKKGKVIITSSILGNIPLPFLGCYASSKSAITMMSECLNLELKKIKSNIKIKLIEPGAYHTGFNQVMINNKEPYMEKSIFFNNITLETIIKQNKLFELIEKKKLTSVVNKMTHIIETNNNKFKYRTPFLQALLTKLYLIFIK